MGRERGGASEEAREVTEWQCGSLETWPRGSLDQTPLRSRGTQFLEVQMVPVKREPSAQLEMLTLTGLIVVCARFVAEAIALGRSLAAPTPELCRQSSTPSRDVRRVESLQCPYRVVGGQPRR